MMVGAVCTNCGAPQEPSDRFCPKCGTAVDFNKGDVKAPLEQTSPLAQDHHCPNCGHLNRSDSINCHSCGVSLRTTPPVAEPAPEKNQSDSSGNVKQVGGIFRFLQTWKLTAALAIALAIVLIIVGRKQPEERHVHESLGQDVAARIDEIGKLQKVVEENPGDAESMLRLANLYHDINFLPKAVETYQRYLESKPEDADARVDMGACYYELALTDSIQRDSYFDTSIAAIQKALSYSPQHQLAHFNLGIISLYRGNMEEANAWFTKCVEIDPNSATGRRADQFLSQHKITKH